MDMSDNSAPAEGGKKVIILCEKVSKEDIKVRFFDYSGWEEWAEFGASGVHKQYAISLTVPRYIHNYISMASSSITSLTTITMNAIGRNMLNI